MELNQLRTFATVAEEGHLTRAAERLHTSQSAVSAQIRALEEELGVSLFNRLPKGMSLTGEGALLRDEALRAIAAAEGVRKLAGRLKSELSGCLRIGMNTDPEFLRLKDMLAWMRERHPRVELDFRLSKSGLIVRDIKAKELDAGFFFGEYAYPEIELVRLPPSKFLIVAPASWQGRITGAGWEELAALPWIWNPTHCPCFDPLDEKFRERGLNPARELIADNEALMRALVNAEAGLTLMREDEAVSAMENGEICIWESEHIELPFSLGYLKSRENDRLVGTFTEAVSDLWGVA